MLFRSQAALGPFMGFAWVADLLYRNTGPNGGKILGLELPRSEERRVGKECRSRGSPEH